MMIMTTTKTLTPPFRFDIVGSYLRPENLKVARQKRANGEISAEKLRVIEDAEIKKLVEKQKALGLKAVTDGDFRRGWWHLDFLSGLDGVELYDTEYGIKFKGATTKNQGLKITGKIDFSNHYMIRDYKFLHQVAGNHLAKYTIPSPNMLFARYQANEFYDTDEVLFQDLVVAYQKTIQAFYDAGCRYLQLDDTSWIMFFSEHGQQQVKKRGYSVEQLSNLFARCVNESIANKPDDMYITMHICRGNFRSTYIESGSYEAVSEIIFGKLDVDGLFLEFDDERSGDFKPLRHVNRPELKVVLGLLTSKFPELEDPVLIKNRIKEATQYVPLEQLCLSTQCGFASTEEGNILTEEEQWEKLQHVIRIAKDVWRESD